MRESLTKVEELPSGKRVFYIDVGNIPADQVEEYMKRMRIALNEQNSYVLPVRSNSSVYKLESDLHWKISFLLIAVIFIQVFILGLALIK